MQFMLNLTSLLLLHSSVAMGAKLCAVFVVPSREVREVKDAVGVMQPKGKLGCQPATSLHSFTCEKKKDFFAVLPAFGEWANIVASSAKSSLLGWLCFNRKFYVLVYLWRLTCFNAYEVIRQLSYPSRWLRG